MITQRQFPEDEDRNIAFQILTKEEKVKNIVDQIYLSLRLMK